MGYELLLTAIFQIGLCNKFPDQSSVKGLSRQWVEFQKVRAGRILTTNISMCVDWRYLYFFPDRKITKYWTIRIHCNARVSTRWRGWVSKKENSHRNCLTFRQRVISPHNVIWGGFRYSRWQNYRLEPPKPNLRTLAKTSSCGSFYMGNRLLYSETLVYMWIEPSLSYSLYKIFQTMACAIRSPMQWHPSNRKLAVCLTGNELNKVYCNMQIES